MDEQESFEHFSSLMTRGQTLFAIKGFETLAESGHTPSLLKLAEIYLDGHGGFKDSEQAKKYLEQAADKGHVEAAYKLGWMFDNGIGVIKDYPSAAKWYTRAAERGHKDANQFLEDLYEEGLVKRESLNIESTSPEENVMNTSINKNNEESLIDDLLPSESGNGQRFYFDSLESIRRRLLDLTGRNSLLNYNHPKGRCVRLIDELPGQIFDVLSNDGKFIFIPVPEPTEEELVKAGYIKFDTQKKERIAQEYPTADQWAKYLGLDTSYELPNTNGSESKHQDSNLQTLLYAPELESRLRNIRNIAESSIEESGANILYLNLGFLEWYESRDSDVARIAPLFTLPVILERSDLDRKSGAYRYTVQLKDDNLISNITLREKLSNDFGLVLPAVEEGLTPEEYFEAITKSILTHQPRWKVKRQASLVLLNFAKQAMYEDLDPKNWPANASIADHPLIRLFFTQDESSEGESNLSYETEYLLDEMNNIQEQYPLIYDADSSQHSAIVDVIEGKNLVIEGPPGSGKSQTITNIIAASIANGKKVLFVAEKMAALNVVKHRLDNAGLGDFCLELHSHKTNKQKIFHDLNTRLQNQPSYQNPTSLDADIARYEDLKSKLNKYAYKINSKWKNTDLTIHEILNKYTRLYEQYKIHPDTLKIDGLSGDNLTVIKQNELYDFAHMLDSIYAQVSQQTVDGKIESHLWFGVRNPNLNSHQIQETLRLLKDWHESLTSLLEEWNKSFEDDPTLSEVDDYLNSVSELPKLIGGEQLEKLLYFSSNLADISKWLEIYLKSHETIESLRKNLAQEYILEQTTPEKLKLIVETFSTTGGPYLKSIRMLIDDKNVANEFKNLVVSINEKLENFRPNVPEEFSRLLNSSAKSLNEINKVCDFIDTLPAELWKYRSDVFDDTDLDIVIPKVSAYVSKMRLIYNKLKDNVIFENLPSTSNLISLNSIVCNGGFFKWFSSEWRDARKTLLRLAKTSNSRSQFLTVIPDLIEFSENADKLVKIRDENIKLNNFIKGVDTPYESIESLRNWYKEVRKEFGVGFGDRVVYANALFALNKDTAFALSEAYKLELINDINELNKNIEYFKNKYPQNPISSNPRELLCLPDSSLSIFANSLNTIHELVEPIIRNIDVDFNEIVEIIKTQESLHSNIGFFEESKFTSDIAPRQFHLEIDLGGLKSDLVEVIKNTLKISEIALENSLIRDQIESDPSVDNYEAILNNGSLVASAYKKSQLLKDQFVVMGDVDFEQWISSGKLSLASIIEKNGNAVNNPSWLTSWTEYNQLKHRLYKQGFENIITSLEAAQTKRQDLKDIISLVICHQLSNEIFKENEDLAIFIGLEQTAIQQRFNEYDSTIIKLQRKKIAYRASRTSPASGVSSGKVSQYTEVSLIKHEATKKSRHIAVRTLLKRAGQAIQTLKPCFMMSPMSVAQYLEPGKFNFDLVVMDEASQIKPEDALGAVARGASFVVVGDPKQLPPTSFFNKILNEESEEEMVGLQDSESILESVMPIFKTRRLRWHYRSKHESLIAFSNKYFYDSDLVLFPSPFKSSDEFGVKLHKIPRGRFTNRRNIEEAQEVAKYAAMHLLDNPKESLGIVAMNAEQRDEIERQLDQLGKDQPAIAEAMEQNKNSDEPLFIKNLENVQGDERDIIYISMTYGPEQIGGKTMQRFGPINSDVGWRRLNVLFTRSKKRMHIFTSMASWDVVSETNRGVRSLKAFLEYAETGHLHSAVKTGKEADSDFELAVMKMLSDNGYTCEPQLGVAGFFLDIAVRDPGNHGRFLMGIECDGATYHSAKSARDRDHLRQEILESLGWKIRRIWSTDWFKNPSAQIQPILNELDKLRTHSATKQLDEELMGLPEDIHQALESLYVEAVSKDIVSFEDATKHVLMGVNEYNGLELSRSDFESVCSLKALESAFDNAIELKRAKESTSLEEEQNLGIRDRLLKFNEEVIKSEFPKTEESKRLLRPEMLEALLEHLPTSKAEFQEVVPAYLRTGTVTYEAKFLDQVLSLIADYA